VHRDRLVAITNSSLLYARKSITIATSGQRFNHCLRLDPVKPFPNQSRKQAPLHLERFRSNDGCSPRFKDRFATPAVRHQSFPNIRPDEAWIALRGRRVFVWPIAAWNGLL
jgi:hypothetical protein